jgi:hypothetical protein
MTPTEMRGAESQAQQDRSVSPENRGSERFQKPRTKRGGGSWPPVCCSNSKVDQKGSCREARRVLRRDGLLIIGFIDRGSELGQRYESRKATSRFYQAARFYSSKEVAASIRNAGFTELRFCQTLFSAADEDTPSVYNVREGYGAGGFVVVSARHIG